MMGFFSAWSATNAYEAALKDCGVNPRSLPADFNGRICSYANQNHERSFMRDYIPLSFVMERAATMVALCILGPNAFARYDDKNGISMSETVPEAAQAWASRGPDATLDTKIIQTVSDAGLLNASFIDAFNAML
jgi:hypothetical protein